MENNYSDVNLEDIEFILNLKKDIIYIMEIINTTLYLKSDASYSKYKLFNTFDNLCKEHKIHIDKLENDLILKNNSFNKEDCDFLKKLLYFYYNDFESYLIEYYNSNYSCYLTQTNKNKIIDIVYKNYTNDLFFNHFLDNEIYHVNNNERTNVKKHLNINITDENLFLKNEIINCHNNKKNKTFIYYYLEMTLNYIDEENFNQKFSQILNKINFKKINDEFITESLLAIVLDKLNIEKNINLFNYFMKYLVTNDLLTFDLYTYGLAKLDYDKNDFFVAINSKEWLEFENYKLNNGNFLCSYVDYFKYNLNPKRMNINDYFTFYKSILKNNIDYRNYDKNSLKFSHLFDIFDESIKNNETYDDNQINTLLYKYISEYMVKSETKIISPTMVFHFICNNSVYFPKKTKSKNDSYYSNLSMYFEISDSFLNNNSLILNEEYNELMSNIVNLFVNHSNETIDTINALLLYSHMYDYMEFKTDNLLFIKNNPFYKKYNIDIKIFNENDLNIEYFLNKVDKKNIIDNHLNLILNELTEYLCFHLSYMNFNIKNDFISLFLQNLHCNFQVINTNLNKKLIKIGFSKNYLTKYSNLIDIFNYKENLTNKLNVFILQNSNRKVEKFSKILTQINYFYKYKNNKKIKI